MKNHFKHNWAIWLVNIFAVCAYFFIFKITYLGISIITLCELFIAVSFYLKHRKNEVTVNDVIKRVDEKIVIKGIFRKKILKGSEIEQIKITKDIFSKIFDWSQVVIVTKTSRIKIHTKMLKLPE